MKSRRNFLRSIAAFVLLLGIKDGYIALWHGNEAEPVRVFPYRADLLPEPERRMLEQGIPIRDESQLHSLLEDYLS